MSTTLIAATSPFTTMAESELAYAFWQEMLQAVPTESLSEPLGPLAGPYREEDKKCRFRVVSAIPRFPTDHEPAIDVRPALGRFDDVAAILGRERPDAGCWCMSYRDSRVRDRSGYMRTECATEPGPGVLLYVDDVVAGWCSIAPRASYRRLLNSRTIPDLGGGEVWVAVCFVVRVGYRKHGLMHRLLTGAVQHAADNGAEVVEGYPVDVGGGRVDVVAGYVGTVALFERAGFQRAAPTTGHSGGRPRWVMRKELH